MEYRKLGKSGLKVRDCLWAHGSPSFGNQLHMSDAKKLLQSAYDKGINFFDNAEGYEAGESEKIMGGAISALGLSRDTYAVSSKVYWGGGKPTQMGLSAKHVRDACDAALIRLKVDYLDLFYCHRPDVDTPIEETTRAMHNLVQQGKVMYWGSSEWSAQQITEAHAIARQEHLTPQVVFGEALEFSLSLESNSARTQALMIDYIVHHQKANGKTSGKVFKWSNTSLFSDKILILQKKHAIKKSPPAFIIQDCIALTWWSMVFRLVELIFS